jgi:hypothetical protein
MKRSVRRESDLPSFSLSRSDVELIWRRLQPLLVDAEHAHVWLDIEFENERITLESVEELATASFPSGVSTNFTLHCHALEHSLHLYTALHAGATPKLVVTSQSEVWAAGAREVVLTVINQNKVWHHWLRPNFVALLLFLGTALATFSVAVLKARNLPHVGVAAAGAIGTLLVLTLLYFGRSRILPMATLRLSEQENFWRRHSVEITLAAAIVSALLTAYGLFAPRSGA